MKIARVVALAAWSSLEAAVLAAVFLNKFDGRLFHAFYFLRESLALAQWWCSGGLLIYFELRLVPLKVVTLCCLGCSVLNLARYATGLFAAPCFESLKRLMTVSADTNNLHNNAKFASNNLLVWVAFAESAVVMGVGYTSIFRSGSLALDANTSLHAFIIAPTTADSSAAGASILEGHIGFESGRCFADDLSGLIPNGFACAVEFLVCLVRHHLAGLRGCLKHALAVLLDENEH